MLRAGLLIVLALSWPMYGKADRPRETELAVYSFIVHLSGGDLGVTTATLTDRGTIEVEIQVFEGLWQPDSLPVRVLHPKPVRLSPAVFASVRSDAASLANVRINVQWADLCLAVIPTTPPVGRLFVRRDYAPGMDAFRGELGLVSSGFEMPCPWAVGPELPSAAAIAYDLRVKLATLVAERLGSRLSSYTIFGNREPVLVDDALPTRR